MTPRKSQRHRTWSLTPAGEALTDRWLAPDPVRWVPVLRLPQRDDRKRGCAA